MKKHGDALRRSRSTSCAGSPGRSPLYGGGPIASASSRKYSATLPELRPSAPAPTQTTSPLAQSWSIHVGEYAPVRRGSTSRSHTSAGSARPCSGTSTSRRRSMPGAGRGMAVDALPARQERRERALVGGLDLLAQHGEGGAAQAPEHLGVAPLALAAAGPQLPAHEVSASLERLQRARRVDAVAVAQLGGRERPVRARVAGGDLLERALDVFEERLGQAAGRDGAERVAIEAGVVGGDPARLAADAQRDRAAFALERLQHPVGVGAPQDAIRDLRVGQVADAAEDVVRARRRSPRACGPSGAAGRPRPARARRGR